MEEPKTLPKTMFNNKGEQVPIVISCPCGQQMWSVPKNKRCVDKECGLELTHPEKEKEVQGKKRFISGCAKSFLESYKAPEVITQTEDPDERQSRLTQAQAGLDQALQTKSLPEAVLKVMREEVEELRKPPVKQGAKVISYNLRSKAETAAREENKHWEAHKKQMDARASA